MSMIKVNSMHEHHWVAFVVGEAKHFFLNCIIVAHVSTHSVLPHLIPAVDFLSSKHGCVKSLADVLADVMDDLQKTTDFNIDVSIKWFGKQQ